MELLLESVVLAYLLLHSGNVLFQLFLFFGQLFQVLLILPVKFLFVNEFAHQLVNLLLCLFNLRHRLLSGVLDTFVVGIYLILNILFGRDSNLEHLRACRLWTMYAVVVPNFEIIGDIFAHLQIQLTHIQSIIELLRGKSLVEGQWVATHGVVGRIGGGFHKVEGEFGKAVVVLYLSAEKDTVVTQRIAQLRHGNHRCHVGNGGDGVKQYVRRFYITVGGKETVSLRGEETFGKRDTSVLVGGEVLRRAVENNAQIFSKLRLERPLHRSALRHGEIAHIGEHLRLSAGVGGIDEFGVEIQKQRLGKHLKLKGLRLHSHRLEMELHGFLHVLKKIGEGGFAILPHLVRLLADNHENLVGQRVADNLHLQREVLLFHGLQGVGEELEGEGCGLFVESAVV